MANTFIKIASVSVTGASQASIEFTSIPQTYTDLFLVYSARASGSSTSWQMDISLNSSTTGFNSIYLQGGGTSVVSGTLARYGGNAVGNTATASTFNNTQIYFPNYTTSANKVYNIEMATENDAAAADRALIAGIWTNSAAITSITLTPNASATVLQHSMATLYGIKSS